MIKLTREEWRACPNIVDFMNSRKESVGVLNDKGEVSMYIAYQAPRKACCCKPADRLWECMACNGYISHTAVRDDTLLDPTP